MGVGVPPGELGRPKCQCRHRQGDSTFNLSSLAPPSEAPSKPSEKDQAPPRLIIEEFSIDGGEIDFSSPETVNALEVMFSERFGADALKALKVEQKEDLEKADKAPSAAKISGSRATVAEEDPGQLAKNLLARLAEVEPVDETALVKLADARAQAIVAEMTDAGRLVAERIKVKPSVPDEKKDAVSAELSLEAGS